MDHGLIPPHSNLGPGLQHNDDDMEPPREIVDLCRGMRLEKEMSYAQIALVLKEKHNVEVSVSTVRRWCHATHQIQFKARKVTPHVKERLLQLRPQYATYRELAQALSQETGIALSTSTVSRLLSSMGQNARTRVPGTRPPPSHYGDGYSEHDAQYVASTPVSATSGHYIQCPPGYVPVFIASEHYRQAMNFLASLPSVKTRHDQMPMQQEDQVTLSEQMMMQHERERERHMDMEHERERERDMQMEREREVRERLGLDVDTGPLPGHP
ncbi:hypothetical protein KIPB_007084 [Kipferlia bialata]|uniref:Uncharacterized protein n=1 Tax=Kipferlia bialata TaxID=797122 RepID=A0A9K3GJR3_9EUKA|nr:hypothetical protein KIPB_007084 [Kipferlia bialata]|eukprot:g7084.t1